MPRRSRQLPTGIYEHFITARCSNQDWFRIPLEEVWSVFSNYLHFCDHAFDFRVRAFVLMANHYHMLTLARSDTLPPGMNYLQREVAKEINRATGRTNQVWGSRYHSSLIVDRIHQLNVYKYLLRNPVEAGVCNLVEEYPFSTLPGLLGRQKLIIPTHDTILFPDVDMRLKWLNTPSLTKSQREDIRNGLKFKEFQLKRTPTGRPNPLNFEAP